MDMKKFRLGLILGIFLLMNASVVFAQATEAPQMICSMLCNVAKLVLYVVVFIAVIMIILYGAKWATSGEDPEARTSAKNAIVHVIIAWIAIFIALYVISWLAGVAGIAMGSIVDPVLLLTSNCDGICSGISF